MALVDAPLPPEWRQGGRPGARRSLFRDLYLDTADDSLRRRGVACRLRISANDRRLLMLRIAGRQHGATAEPVARFASAVAASDAPGALRERSGVGRRLRAITDPERLVVRGDLEVERYSRVARRDWLRRPTVIVLYEQVTVRLGSASRSFQQLRICGMRDGVADVEALAVAFERAHGVKRIAADTRERAELLLKWMESEYMLSSISRAWPAPAAHNGDGRRESTSPFLNSELSLLEFNARVLAMAEDLTTPLAERLRFLAILASNLDEFFMVRVAGLLQARHEQIEEVRGGEAAASRQAQLDVIALRASSLVARQYRCYRGCMAELGSFGTRVLSWEEVDDRGRALLRERFREEIYPALTPMALTLAPGHPFPRPSHLSLSLAVVLLDAHGGAPRLACVQIPAMLPRIVVLPGSSDLVLIEDVVRANLDLLYPRARVEQAYAFRATRAGDLTLDEDAADDLLEAVDAAARLRGDNEVVRVEVDRGMPLMIRELVLNELRDELESSRPPGHADVYEVDGPLDLRFLHELPMPPDPALRFHPFEGRSPVSERESLWEAIAARDILVHHPFEPFDATVLRFFRDAALDPDVVSIRTTLYRTGDRSPVVEALRDAAARGKQVAAFVELKARFEEERNVAATRSLEDAGGHVVYGLVGLKNHAKVALVVRREGGRLRRYVHVGTGNYNAVTARQYTDLSLFSAAEPLCEDVTELFNALTGTSRPPDRLTHGALVAPEQLLPAVLELIEREAGHARAGIRSGIRMKLNGVSHPEVVRALYGASQAGVPITLVVRGICTLRPGVAGLSESIRVIAIVGRLLEHSRIYEFTNGGDVEYLIGSSDLRPRNLRRRVELLVPVRDTGATARLARLLDLYQDDPTAWDLGPDGEYTARRAPGTGTQDRLIAELDAAVSAGPGSPR